jgi:hypothetical protein
VRRKDEYSKLDGRGAGEYLHERCYPKNNAVAGVHFGRAR